MLGAGDDDLGLSADVDADLVCRSPDAGDDTGKSVEPGVRHSLVDGGVDDDVDLLSLFESLESPGDGGKNPCRLKFRPMGLPLVSAMNDICKGEKIADLISIGASLDYVIPDIDR